MASVTETDRQALARLLADEDLPCLPPRSRRYVQPGLESLAARQRLKRTYARAWLEFRLESAGRFESEVVSVRRQPLRLVRRLA